MQHIPYTYLLKWTEYNVSYYGVRYSKNCHPNDLWNPYQSSSKHVKKFIELRGDPDVIQIRKTFNSKEKAQHWENTVLRRLKVRKKSNWLNINPGAKGFFSKSGKDHFCFGKAKSIESKIKQSKTRLKRSNAGLYNFNNHTTEQLEAIRKIGQSNKGRKASEETKIKQSTSRKKYLGDNLSFEKEYECSKCKEIFYKKVTHKSQHKEFFCSKKCSNSMPRKINKKECQNCGKLLDPGNFSKYHGDKCKSIQ